MPRLRFSRPSGARRVHTWQAARVYSAVPLRPPCLRLRSRSWAHRPLAHSTQLCGTCAAPLRLPPARRWRLPQARGMAQMSVRTCCARAACAHARSGAVLWARGWKRRRSLLLPQQSVQSASRGLQRSDCAGSRRRGARAAGSAVCAPLPTPAIFVALPACPARVASGRLLEVFAAAHHPRHCLGYQLGAFAGAHASAAR